MTGHAHHGFAVHYDVTNQIHIEGTIQAIRYRNPHAEISVLVTDGTGEETIWSCETQASSILARKGITKDRFPIGGQLGLSPTLLPISEFDCEPQKTDY